MFHTAYVCWSTQRQCEGEFRSLMEFRCPAPRRAALALLPTTMCIGVAVRNWDCRASCPCTPGHSVYIVGRRCSATRRSWMSTQCIAWSGGQDMLVYWKKVFSHLIVAPRELRDKVVVKAEDVEVGAGQDFGSCEHGGVLPTTAWS